MLTQYKRFIHWLPRMLAIVGIFFISLFALDVFSEYDNVLQLAVAFFMHLIPTYVLIAVTIIAWQHRRVGGLLFIAVGLLTIVAFKTYIDPIVFLLITMPPVLVGVLFIWDSLFASDTEQVTV